MLRKTYQDEFSYFFFNSCTVHLDIIKVLSVFTNRCTIYLLRSTLRFTLKLLLYVTQPTTHSLMQSHSAQCTVHILPRVSPT